MKSIPLVSLSPLDERIDLDNNSLRVFSENDHSMLNNMTQRRTESQHNLLEISREQGALWKPSTSRKTPILTMAALLGALTCKTDYKPSARTQMLTRICRYSYGRYSTTHER